MNNDKYYDEPVEVTMPRKHAIKLKHILAQNPDADVEDVVKCKNCKHCEHCFPSKAKGEEPVEGWYCNTFRQWRSPDDFCSYGRRKEVIK